MRGNTRYRRMFPQLFRVRINLVRGSASLQCVSKPIWPKSNQEAHQAEAYHGFYFIKAFSKLVFLQILSCLCALTVVLVFC